MATSKRKERERQHKLKLFLDISETLFFDKGYENTTMDEIAEMAEYSKGTLYQYYPSKEVLLLAICLRGINLMRNMFTTASNNESLGIDKIGAIGRAYYEYLTEHSNYYNIISKLSLINFRDMKNQQYLNQLSKIDEEIDEMMANSLSLGIKDGSIRSDINIPIIVQLLKGMSDGVFRHLNTLKQRENVDTNEMFKSYFDLLEGILKK